MAEFLIERQRGHVRRITLNRPDKLNAMPPPMVEDFYTAVEAAAADPETRVIVIAGAGRAFSSGADLKAAADSSAATRDPPGDMAATRARVERWLRLWSTPTPLIAQVQGYCLGIANELVGACDLVVCGESARFGMPEVREFALPPTLGFWPIRIGLAKTKELLFTGRYMDGTEAVAAGMASSCVPDAELEATVDELADRIAQVPAALLAVIKQAANGWAETWGVHDATRRGGDYHALYHTASTWAERFGR
jgi:enoyl-CoA hydratase